MTVLPLWLFSAFPVAPLFAMDQVKGHGFANDMITKEKGRLLAEPPFPNFEEVSFAYLLFLAIAFAWAVLTAMLLSPAAVAAFAAA